jgi:ketosteroid isomerase-like protein
MKKRKLVEEYVNGWREGDEEKIMRHLSSDCVIVESDNSTYRGREEIYQWIRDWNKKRSKVNKWNISSYDETEDMVFFEWHFQCTVTERLHEFDGASFVKFTSDKISYMREYRAVRKN